MRTPQLLLKASVTELFLFAVARFDDAVRINIRTSPARSSNDPLTYVASDIFTTEDTVRDNSFPLVYLMAIFGR